jgi:Cu+-exporting ATPase
MLSKKQLYKYYEIERTPGIKVEKHDFAAKYAFLDNEEIRDKMLDFSEGEVSKVTLYIPTIHCSSCIWLLENMHLLNKGVKSSLVNFVKKEVSITFKNHEITLRQLVELLASVHYIPQITLDKIEGKEKPKSNTGLLIKIGVAGFVFGNIMLLSMPEYLAIRGQLDAVFQGFFGWIKILLSLPVLFYCSSGYWLSAYKNLKHKIINIDLPITLGIIALAAQSYVEILVSGEPGYLDSLAGFVFFLLIGKWYQDKTYQSLAFDRDYKSYFPVAVTKITAEGEESTPLKNLVAGDIILIRNQELIPADGVLKKGQGFIDYSFVTGESLPVNKKEGDVLYAGGKQIGSAIRVIITKDVAQSQLTQLWNQNSDPEKTTSRISSLIDRLSKNFTIAVLLIATMTAIFWYFFDPSKAIIAFTSVLIVACPCAVALSMPFSFGTTMRIFGGKGFYLKNTGVVERITRIDTVVFDKTGTITHNRSKNVVLTDGHLSLEESIAVKSLARQSAHPLSMAVFDFLDSDHIDEVENFMEIPASGIKGTVDGMHLKVGSMDFIQHDGEYAETAASEVFVAIDGVFKARFTIESKYREGIDAVIETLLPDYELHVLSGDNDSDRSKLGILFRNSERLYFRQSPNDKLEYIKNLKKQNKHVLMIGDGLNDAGALNASDVGISIADDIYQFSPACDAILESGRFADLVKFIRFSGISLNIVKASYFISVFYNIVGLSFAVQGILSPIIAAILMPLSSVTVVTFVTFSTRIAARVKLK